MLYTEAQMTDYALFCVNEGRVPNTGSLRLWCEKNDVHPIQRGQVLTIGLRDGITISAEIESVEQPELKSPL